jgi:hypothetical protein
MEKKILLSFNFDMALYSWLLNSRILDYTLTGVTIAVIAVLGGIYTMQTKLIYVPHFPPGSRKEVWRPSRFGFTSFEEVTLSSSDGVKLHAFWIPCHTRQSNQVPTILFFHVRLLRII